MPKPQETEVCKFPGCSKDVLNKWSLCLPHRKKEQTCRCGEKYMARGLKNVYDRCQKCRQASNLNEGSFES